MKEEGKRGEQERKRGRFERKKRRQKSEEKIESGRGRRGGRENQGDEDGD